MRLAMLLFALIPGMDSHATALHTVEPRTPTAEWIAALDALRANDVRALEAAIVPPHVRERNRREHRAFRDAVARGEHQLPVLPDVVESLWQQLRTPGGVALIVAAWRPAFAAFADSQVELLSAQLPRELELLAERDDLTAEDFVQRRTLLLAAEQWAHATDFGDALRFERALTAIAMFAQTSGIDTIDGARLLSPDELLAHGGAALHAAKTVLAAYDLDADAMLRGARITEHRDDIHVSIRIDATVLGVPVAFTQRLTYWHGDWHDADYIARVDRLYRASQVYPREDPAAVLAE